MAYETTDQLIAEISDHWVKDPRGNVYKLLDTYNTGFEQISDMADKVERWRAIQDAEGTTLDLFGQDINASRPTKADDPYRFLIRLKILLSRAQGTIPSIVHITSTALGTDKGIKIWHTAAPRHIGIRLPWDYVNDDYIQRFLVNNLQHMLALGYWLDCIVFRSDSPLPLYIGAGTQIKKHKIERSKTVWWTGWHSRTTDNLHVGIYTQMQRKRHQRSETVWWDGWKARAPTPAFIAVAGRAIKTQVWHSPVLWADKQTEELHAGLTVGSKIITQATQSLTTE
ncbi:hypothetical protein [Lactobacillus crispatus]|uniref:hypothetical protein n=1 Tax=Lactobacillus crispatus TaxID=47770 RepID=UPI003F290DD3